uniref:Uncharacterized protein n=1 Tax=Anguilla anguilla TaxID=7936 RepID=A0A0E9WU98_ANGAN
MSVTCSASFVTVISEIKIFTYFFHMEMPSFFPHGNACFLKSVKSLVNLLQSWNN